jgi:hypothetical protein
MRITAFACSARMAPTPFFVRDVRGDEYSRHGCVFALSIAAAAANIDTVMLRRPLPPRPRPRPRFGKIH